MERGDNRIPGPVRELSPCKDCTRPWKKPGCHDTCKDFAAWKAKGKQVNKAREEYMKSKYHYARGLSEEE